MVAAFLSGLIFGVLLVSAIGETVVIKSDKDTNKKIVEYKNKLYTLEELK